MPNVTINENKEYVVDTEEESSITLRTANTYVDKNIVVNIPLSTKADIDSPDFTGTPTINSNAIATIKDLPTDYIVNGENDGNVEIRVISADSKSPNTIKIIGENANISVESGYDHNFTGIGIVKGEAYFNADNEENGLNASFNLKPGSIELAARCDNGDDDDYNSTISLGKNAVILTADADEDNSIKVFSDGNGIIFNSTGPIDYFSDGDIGYTTEGSNIFTAKGGSDTFTADTNISFLAGEGIIITAEEDIELTTNGIATYNGSEIATKMDIVGNITADNEPITDAEGTPGVHTTLYVSGDEVTDFTIMDGHKGDRGTSLLHVSTPPWANSHQTPDKLVHTMAMKESEIKAEALVDIIYLGDLIEWNGFLYHIAYMGDPQTITLTGTGSKVVDVYVDSIGNIKGPQGPQGIQGEQGPQGPKGDPGEGFFIVTDEDYSKIADFVEEKSYHSYQRPNASEPIRPNIFYDFGPQYQLDITFETPQSIYRSNEYMFQFESPADRPTTLIMPSSVKWCYDPTIEAGKTYQVSVLNNLAVICGA